ncbi:MAG: ABC transporter permease, partial [Planctomycetota bacterium]
MTRWRAALIRFVATYGIVAALGVEIIVFWALSPRFLTWGNQLNVLRQNAAIAIIAAGMTFVILTAGIDLSVGSLVAVAGVFCAMVLKPDWGPLWLRLAAGCIIGVLSAACAGLFSGVVVTRMRIPPFVSTLAMLTIARGVALHITESETISGLPEWFGEVGGSNKPVVLMVLIF